MANALGVQCASCGRSLDPQQGPGRQRRYCDATCRSAARRQRAVGSSVKDNLTTGAAEASIHAMDGVPPLDAVRQALAALREAEAQLRASVEAARESGHTWAEIGDVLGTTRQAAFQRFGRAIDPRTGEPMDASVLPGAAEAAVALFVALAEGDWEAVRLDFDAKVAQALPDADAVAATWAMVAGRCGRYEQHMGEPFTRQLGDYTVVDVPLQFEIGEQTGRVSFSRDGKVAGLFVLPPELG
jgi:Protein of unknown function (DUF3887)